MVDGLRRCSKCREEKPLSAFSRNYTHPSGYQTACKHCQYDHQRAYRQRVKERFLAGRSSEAPPTASVLHPVVEQSEKSPKVIVSVPAATLNLNNKAELLRGGFHSVLILGDIHFPWHHEEALALALELAGDLQPACVVQIGDLYDLYAFSKYVRSRNLYTPKAETEMARSLAEKMWATLRHRCPDAHLFQVVGNHDERVAKRLMESLPELEHLALPAIEEKLFSFPEQGVITQTGMHEELIIDDTVYIHGSLQLSKHAPRYGCNVVAGDKHKGELKLHSNISGSFWELTVGWLGNIHAPVYGYRQQRKLVDTNLGVGIVDHLGPRFVPF